MNDEESVIYTDGRHVKVTSRELVVDSARYLLNSINNVRLHFVKHFKYPPLTLIIAGIFLVIAGLSGLFQNIHLEEIYILDFLITSDSLFIIVGSLIAMLGLLWLFTLHNEYVLVISTEEGEYNPISGKKKDELNKIVAVLSNAIPGFNKRNSKVE